MSKTAETDEEDSRAAFRGSAHTESSSRSHNPPRHPLHYNPNEGLSGQDLQPPPLSLPTVLAPRTSWTITRGGSCDPTAFPELNLLSGW